MIIEQLSFTLPVFEGPLDLLLHLTLKHKLNINDIPISELVDQYLDYIDKMASLDMEIAGDFLEMAARLIYIKTLSLLPKHEESVILKKELEGRLIEYSICKEAANALRQLCDFDIYTRNPMKIQIDMTYALTHDSELLRKAYMNIDKRKLDEVTVSDKAFTKIVAEKYVPVASMIVTVLKKLYTSGNANLDDMFSDIKNKSERVAAFLAVLELTRSGRILLNDDNSEIFLNNNYKNESESENISSDFDKESEAVNGS